MTTRLAAVVLGERETQLLAQEATLDILIAEAEAAQKASGPHEQAAREKRARKLACALDAALLVTGTEPASEFGLRMVAAFGDREWAEAAKEAGITPPSTATRGLVLSIYRLRVQAMARLSAESGAEIERAGVAVPEVARG